MTKEEYLMIIDSYMNTFLQKKIAKYQQISPDHLAASPAVLDRIPVWIFWWQGIDAMPEIIQLCYQSVCHNLPAGRVSIHFLDQHNYKEYITLPDIVEEKLSQEVIKIAHFSDILRSTLLFEYGGWWIDASIFIGKPLSADFVCANSFFTQCYGFPVDAPYPDPAKGRWATYLLRSPKGFPLFEFLYECWLFYLDRHDKVLDYYLTDYMIAIAYHHFEWAKNVIDAVLPNNLHVGDLMAFYGNQEYDAEWIKTLTDDTQFFKMTYKVNLSKTTEAGNITAYGALCQQYLCSS